MSRLTVFIWALLVTIAGGIIYHTSYQVRALEERLDSVSSAMVREQEAIRVLKADWSHVNDPARLERLLAETDPLLQPMALHQMVSVADIPDKASPAEIATLASAVPLPQRKPSFLGFVEQTAMAETAPVVPTTVAYRQPQGSFLLAHYAGRR